MAKPNEVQLLKNILTAVDESKIKIIFSIQCSKAQASLLRLIQKKIKIKKHILNFITDGNKKIEVEIKLAEQELNNIIIACNTIQSGNIEITKELLLKREENSDCSKKIESGEKKYEELWLTSKRRFENIPSVKQCLQGKEKIQLISNNINSFRNKCLGLSDEITTKKRTIQNLTQIRVIDLTNFLVNDRPKIIKTIQNTLNKIKELTREIENLEQQSMMNSRYSKVQILELQENLHPEEETQKEKKFDHNDNEAFVMPNLLFMDVDLDILGAKLDEIKKIDMPTTEENKIKPRGYKIDAECSSTNFSNKWESFCSQNKSYSDRKLIHIIDDIALERNQTLNIISNVEVNNLQNVKVIESKQTGEELSEICSLSEEKVSQPSKKIQEKIDNIEEQNVQSPTQILDRKKKKVSFDFSMENSPCELTETENNLNVLSNFHSEGGNNDETLNSHNVSLHSDQGNDKLLHEVDKFNLSPEFVYAKHVITKKIIEGKVRTSKFFDAKNTQVSEPSVISSHTIGERETKVQEIQDNNFTIQPTMNISENNTFNPSSSKVAQEVQEKNATSGLLLEHGSHAIPDPLNVSFNATGFDGDDSYPQCLDSSVLLSPKADVSMDAPNNNITGMPQEVYNFMSGVRKIGSSFLERLPNYAQTNTRNTEGNFNFNFSSGEKKNKGFFSMF